MLYFIQKQAQKLHEEGKALFKDGKINEASRKYEDAMKLCREYNLLTEACEVFYSSARLYMDQKEYRTAYTQCSQSLQIMHTAKVMNWSLRCITYTYMYVSFLCSCVYACSSLESVYIIT